MATLLIPTGKRHERLVKYRIMEAAKVFQYLQIVI